MSYTGSTPTDVESAASAGGKLPPFKDSDKRFELELEFVQCLANPTYIHYLAQNRYFEDEAFIGYLKYPHCLFFLELLQNANFRNAMAHPANKELAHRQQFFFWKNYRNNRMKHILPPASRTNSCACTFTRTCNGAPTTISTDTCAPTCSCTSIVYATCCSGWCICDVSYAVCRNSWNQYAEERHEKCYGQQEEKDGLVEDFGSSNSGQIGCKPEVTASGDLQFFNVIRHIVEKSC